MLTVVGRVKGILNKARVRASCQDTSALFDILTGKSYYHLPDICAVFRRKYDVAFDEEIRQSNICITSKKVLVHLTRTAVGLVYRDAKLLQDSLEACASSGRVGEGLLAIRVSRMSWYRDHFLQVREHFRQTIGVDFNENVQSIGGANGDIIRQLCD